MAADLHVVLVNPEIHWNTGNTGRTCLATGAQLHLVGKLGFSLDDKNVKRAGLDYWPRVNPILWPTWGEFAAGLHALGSPFLFTALAQTTLWQVTFPRPAVLIFGPESVGLPREIRDAYPERTVSIPMRPDSVRSLNLSTAAAVAAYEVLRQWRS